MNHRHGCKRRTKARREAPHWARTQKKVRGTNADIEGQSRHIHNDVEHHQREGAPLDSSAETNTVESLTREMTLPTTEI